MAVIQALEGMGVEARCTCTPYLAGGEPGEGEHLAWSESSAVSYANSVLGARTNREGGPSALAASIVGRTGRYGLHLEGERLATHLFEVRCPVQGLADYGALGRLVGREARNQVPYLRGLDLALDERGRDQMKALGAAMAASGAVALYHVEGVTPEAASQNMVATGVERAVISDLALAYEALNSTEEAIDLVFLGCPHASQRELEEVADTLRGRMLGTRLWITTSRPVRERAAQRGWVEAIEAAGGQVYTDTCMVVAPLEALGIRSLATNSAKAALYLPTHADIQVRFGSLEQCIACALEGRWPG
jgi:predicted aconitase